MTPFLGNDFPVKNSNFLSDEELRAQIALARAETVPLRFRLALLSRFASAQGVFTADETVLRQAGLSQRHREALAAARRSASRQQKELDALRAAGTAVIGFHDPRYPGRLKETSAPPLVLFGRGDLALLESPAVLAVVGARAMTDYGIQVLEKLIPPLVQAGVVIVSGLAFGVDARAHEICLRSGGKAVAVQAQGVDRGYPSGNQALYEEVVSCGLVLSEFADAPPYSGPEIFPRRNRIVSGISDAVLVVEARVKSGSLVTAHFALGQNRGIYAVPGSVFHELSEGCLSLIRDGAKPVSNASDILEDLLPSDVPLLAGIDSARSGCRIAADVFETELERGIFAACSGRARTVDDLVEICGGSAPSVTAAVTKMSLFGKLAEGKEGFYSLAK